MKKYILKINNGIELTDLIRSDILYEILAYIQKFITKPTDLKRCSIWMNGKVLE